MRSSKRYVPAALCALPTAVVISQWSCVLCRLNHEEKWEWLGKKPKGAVLKRLTLYSGAGSNPRPLGGEVNAAVIDDRVGTRPESVVNLRGILPRGSWEVCWDGRPPFRGGETKLAIGASFRGDCCERKRMSSMVSGKRGTRARRIGRAK